MAPRKKTPVPADPSATSRARSELLLYTTSDLQTRIEVRLEDETVWLTQRQMADLFQTTVQNINLHVGNIFAEGELRSEAVIKESLITAADGKSYLTKHFNLDVIISVGYRVKSHRGTQFRIWATQRLREYLVKGFALDDEWRRSAPQRSTEPSRESRRSPHLGRRLRSSQVVAGRGLAPAHAGRFGGDMARCVLRPTLCGQ